MISLTTKTWQTISANKTAADYQLAAQASSVIRYPKFVLAFGSNVARGLTPNRVTEVNGDINL